MSELLDNKQGPHSSEAYRSAEVRLPSNDGPHSSEAYRSAEVRLPSNDDPKKDDEKSSLSNLDSKEYRYLLTYEANIQIVHYNLGLVNFGRESYQIFLKDISKQSVRDNSNKLGYNKPNYKYGRGMKMDYCIIQMSEPILIKIFDMVDKKMIYS
jgi:hypothetical protein